MEVETLDQPQVVAAKIHSHKTKTKDKEFEKKRKPKNNTHCPFYLLAEVVIIIIM